MPTSRRPHWGISPLMRQVLQALCAVAATTSLLTHAGETTNKIGVTMVDIPAGSFMMGSCKSSMIEENKKRSAWGQPILPDDCPSSDPNAEDNETPQHRVSVSAFQMSKTEVTLGQFKQYIAAIGRSDLVDDDFMKYNSNGDNAPVVQVSWNDAQSFIDWLNKTDGGGYRLPSESEWEYACRAGGSSTYCGSDSVGSVAWYDGIGGNRVHDGNSGNRAHSVGTKQGNAFGLYDMSGNVWEWVQDYYHDNYRGAPADGSAWTSGGEQKYRVLRGGSWGNHASYARAANRVSLSPDNRLDDFGLRLARTR